MRPEGLAGAHLLGGAALISDATHCQAASAKSQQYAEQQDDRWSLRRCSLMPCTQLSRGNQDDPDALQDRPNTAECECNARIPYLVYHR